MQVTFHIGAHRTGSSLVARTLAASVAAQPGCGVAVWRPVQVRKINGFTGLHRYEGARRDRIRADIAKRVESAAQNGAGQLIFSEENMPGTMSSNLRRGAFYPEIEHRLQRYAEALPIAPSRIAIGVRSYAAVWSSAYYYSLQRGKTVPGPEAVRQAMMEDARGWIGFVNAARAAWPDVPVILWRQEDLQAELAAVCATLTGLSKDQIVAPLGQVNARTKTGESALFAEEETEALNARYARDISDLRETAGIDWAGSGL